MPQESKSNPLTNVIATVGVLFFMFAGYDVLRHYIRSKYSSEKLTNLRYRGEWSVGEYRECNSLNLREEDDRPDVVCLEPFPSGPSRMVEIKFTGPTYEPAIVDGAVHYWLCRHDNSDVTFSCVKEKETKNEKQSEAEPIVPPPKHELTNKDIENLKRRNECEQRFYDKEVYLANGLSVGKACKQNPNIKP